MLSYFSLLCINNKNSNYRCSALSMMAWYICVVLYFTCSFVVSEIYSLSLLSNILMLSVMCTADSGIAECYTTFAVRCAVFHMFHKTDNTAARQKFQNYIYMHMWIFVSDEDDIWRPVSDHNIGRFVCNDLESPGSRGQKLEAWQRDIVFRRNSHYEKWSRRQGLHFNLLLLLLLLLPILVFLRRR